MEEEKISNRQQELIWKAWIAETEWMNGSMNGLIETGYTVWNDDE